MAFDGLLEHPLVHLTMMVDDDDDGYGDDYGDDHDDEEEGQDNDDLLVHLLDVVILNSLLHPAEQIPF